MLTPIARPHCALADRIPQRLTEASTTSCRRETKIFRIVFIASLQLVHGVGSWAQRWDIECTRTGNNAISAVVQLLESLQFRWLRIFFYYVSPAALRSRTDRHRQRVSHDSKNIVRPDRRRREARASGAGTVAQTRLKRALSDRAPARGGGKRTA